MTFTVKYRGADGAVREECVEAAGREDCFAQMRARGIVPMGVREGAPKGGGRKPNRRPGVSPVHGVRNGQDAHSPNRRMIPYVLVAALVALIGGVWWWMVVRPERAPCQPERPKKVEKTKVEKPATNAVAEVKPVHRPKPKVLRHGERPAVTPTVTGNAGPVPEKPIIPSISYGEVNGSNIWPRAIFKTREENMLVGLMRTRPGTRVIQNGFLPGEEERYRAMLALPVTFNDDDTEEERQIKETMAALKKELTEHVADGGNITDIIQKERDQLNELAAYREKLRGNLFLLHKEGGNEQDTEDYLKEANRTLKEYGMDPLPDPRRRPGPLGERFRSGMQK